MASCGCCVVLLCVQVYFDVDVGGASAGRITFELRADVTPKTAGTWPSVFLSYSKGLRHDIPRQTQRSPMLMTTSDEA